ncbi:response regulator [Pontiella sulfatireligans]|uniref:Transcriptional regulatory protein LiaR n=1 Tax=Pontiella sulfatireligans TaxID=2750658 RepID=A0A6C2UR62_9BACT|nr:response regulator transcription factor [Pontiella sulfatireligans]VGO22433.1 Transcriptional regulatory protein LiaR [Pontiella sulfatireligans]
MAEIRVLVVDDNALLRLGLTETITIEPGLEPVGAAANATEALELVRELRPDVVTMDYQMPGESGVECTRKIMEEFPDTKVVLLSVFDSEEDIWQAVQAGVKGYLTKKAGEVEDVLEAIHEIAAGGTYFPAGIAQKLERRSGQDSLTPREMEVLTLLAEGCSNKQIVDRLGISLATVKLHILNLREKLDAADRTQAVVHAFKRGIIHLDG